MIYVASYILEIESCNYEISSSKALMFLKNETFSNFNLGSYEHY